MNCPHCGTEIKAGYETCAACGATTTLAYAKGWLKYIFFLACIVYPLVGMIVVLIAFGANTALGIVATVCLIGGFVFIVKVDKRLKNRKVWLKRLG